MASNLASDGTDVSEEPGKGDGVETHLRTLVRRATNMDLALGALSAIREIRVRLSELEAEAVSAARGKGASWQDIADALGISRQALQQRLKLRAANVP